MLDCFATQQTKKATSIILIAKNEYSGWLAKQPQATKKWLTSCGFRGEAGQLSLIPDKLGHVSQVLYCVNDKQNFWNLGNLPYLLPEGIYKIPITKNYSQQCAAWGLGSYQFTRYKKPTRKPAKLILEKSHQRDVENTVKSIYLVRDLINMPTEAMGPSELSAAAKTFSKQFKTTIKQTIGNDLLRQNFPCIHLVGRASNDAPRLIDLRWGNKKHPKVTLVGKGVCFDSGGLDIKPASAMLLMKKDMAGAAHVLGLAQMIISAKLPINLRVLIPAVENVISGNAYRPGDIVRSRKGITIEIGNTDAEGRVILADAITAAVSETPDLLIDIASLTGAARVALGTELPAMFSNQDALAREVISHGDKQQDFVWQLPLFAQYRESLNSNIADINNNSSDPCGGAITAALFLKEFVPDNIPWLHFDLMAWNLRARAGRPAGGEAMALRALFSYLSSRFGSV